MTEWALVIHPSSEFRAVVSGHIRDQLPAAQLEEASTLEEARRALRRFGQADCRVVAAGMRTPRNASQPISLDGRDLATLELVREFRADGDATPPFLLITAYGDADQAASLEGLTNLELVSAGLDFHRMFPEALGRLLNPHQNGARPTPCVDLEIRLHRDPPYNWRLERRWWRPFDQSGPLLIDQADLDVLMGLASDDVPSGNYVASLGQLLYKVVMAADVNTKGTRLVALLEQHCAHHGGIGSARIRFNVDGQTHPVLVEAVAEPTAVGSPPTFWMLQAPIFRKYETDSGGRYTLFKDQRSRVEKLDCLLIQGKVDGFDTTIPLEEGFASIKQVTEEVNWLEEFLNAGRDRFNVGEVRVLRYPDSEPAQARRSFSDVLRNTLSEPGRHWRLVHYAGHSAKTKDGKVAYLVMGPASADVWDTEEFAKLASSAQFVYLSSCESADSHFVLQLVHKAIPAVLGYRWPISDLKARAFSELFYRHLFEDVEGNRYLEYAFLKAKRDFHKQQEGPRAFWAAPVLVMQALQAEPESVVSVERGFPTQSYH